MLKKNAKRTCVLMTTCALTAMFSTGCRSMSGKNMFAMRGEPSAEVLAGSGPTTTYPAPPSASATPEAIASVAGGTAAPVTAPTTAMASTLGGETAQVAGIGISPGYATPASSVEPSGAVGAPSTATPTNLAAAQANGIYGGGSATKSAGFMPPANPTTKPAGYTFGAKALTPKAESPASGTAFAMSDAVAADAASATETSGFAPPKTSFAPPSTEAYTSPPVATASASPSQPQGFTFPTDAPAMAAITPPKSDINGFESPAVDVPPPTEIMPPAAVAPDFSTASAAPGITAPSTTSPLDVNPATAGATSYQGYTPGSTGGSSGYPSGIEAPTTSGSFYR